MNFKDINIGQMMEILVTESGIEISRICNFMKSTEEEIQRMFEQESLDSNLLLKWSKILEYDFFRIYSQHLILYAPPSAVISKNENNGTFTIIAKNLKGLEGYKEVKIPFWSHANGMSDIKW